MPSHCAYASSLPRSFDNRHIIYARSAPNAWIPNVSPHQHFREPKGSDVWIDALSAKFDRHDKNFDYKQAFDQVLGDFAAVTDSPCVELWKQLVEAYPDAKIVLVDRDEQKWNKSFALLADGCLQPAAYILRFADPFWFGRVVCVGQAWINAFTGTMIPAKAKKYALPAFRKHYANIRAAIPREKLLEFRLDTGWEPLCKFFGRDIPDQHFPHRNEAATLENAIGAALWKSFKNALFNLAVVVGVGAAIGGGVWKYVL